jgi:hypothetical protein
MKHLYRYAFMQAVILLAVGCSFDQVANQVAAKNDTNMKRLVNLYYGYQMTHGWQGPKDEKALKDFVTEHGLPAKNLAMMGVDPNNLDAIFKSDRDGKPFRVRYGISGGMFSVNPLVFEDSSVSGKKLVAFNGPIVEEEEDARYNDLWEHGGMPMGATPHTDSPPNGAGKSISKQ